MSSETTEEPKTIKSRWMRYWRDPKDKSYMKELPPDDFEMNTVTTVNPYVYLDEIEQAKKQKEYQAKVEIAQRRREMQAKAIKKQEKVFIKAVNTKSSPAWYQDLSVRQPRRFVPSTLNSGTSSEHSSHHQLLERDSRSRVRGEFSITWNEP